MQTRSYRIPMKKWAIFFCFLVFAAFSPLASAQEQPKAEIPPKADAATTPVKLQVVFEEFEGSKKIKSLPYTLYHNTTRGTELQPDFTRLRFNSGVQFSRSPGSWQNLQIATKIDFRAVRNDEGRFLVQLNVDRSWVDLDPSVSTQVANAEHESTSSDTSKFPVTRSISSDLYLSLRDGQALETLAATDPASGRVIRIQVTLNVLK